MRPPPQLAVYRHGPHITEFRVENWRLSRDGTNRVIMGVTGWRWYYAVVPLILSLLLPRVQDKPAAMLGIGLVLTCLVYKKCTQVLWESVIVFPSLGVQLETHRGLPWFTPLKVDRQFIPLESLEDFVIHEGLYGWNVRYYLAAITASPSGAVQIYVAFENLLPHFPVLLPIYRGVQNILRDT
ncbi:hypothetical protein MKEN_01195200 [Mycena kentingensis (nom. inval.)]|nr:hypothetical protein MKEN_01195200 [Mycena kentingensis (nom. inval.)]